MRLTTSLFLLLCVVSTSSVASPGSLPDFTVLVKDNSPAVVNISTTTDIKTADQEGPTPPSPPIPGPGPGDSPLNEFFRKYFGEQMPDGPEGMEPRASLGSGFVISKDGYVISNYHVIKDADQVVVRLSDRREYIAEVIGTDPRSDIAVLKVKADSDLPTLKLGSSENLEVGEWVLAIGSPFGFDHTVTAGIVSAKGRSLPNENYVPFIQTDVAINPGNSGGPLFNLKGEVVGVNSQIYSRTGGFMGLSFAIPIDVVMNVYKQLREKGAVSRGWLGVLIQDVTQELAESFQMDKPHGALVSKVLPDSPGAKAGLETGDVIIKFNGQFINTSSDLPPIVGSAAVGDSVEVELIRSGKTKRMQILIGELPTEQAVQLAQKPPSKSSAATIKRLNVTARELSAKEHQQLENGADGVLVASVAPGPAYDAGLQEGDIILQLNFQEVKSVAELSKLAEKLAPGARVPILIQRQGSPLFMALKIPEK